MREDEFDDVIERYLRGKASPREVRLLEKWFDAIGKEMPLKPASSEREEIMLQRIQQRIDSIGQQEPPPAPVRSKQRWVSIAATLMLLAVAGLSYRTWIEAAGDAPLLEVKAVDTQKKVMLADGSIVWLKPDSQLSFSYTADSMRSVSLEGEGLFEVAKDANHPFVITCRELQVRVVGTSFNIHAREDNVEVTVLTGRVTLQAEATDSMVAMPFEKATFSRQTKQLAKGPVTTTERARVTAGTSYDLRVENMRIRELLEKLEDKFDVELVIQNGALNDCRITADFSDRRLEECLTVLASVFDFGYTKKGNTIALQGGRCNAN